MKTMKTNHRLISLILLFGSYLPLASCTVTILNDGNESIRVFDEILKQLVDIAPFTEKTIGDASELAKFQVFLEKPNGTYNCIATVTQHTCGTGKNVQLNWSDIKKGKGGSTGFFNINQETVQEKPSCGCGHK